MTQCASGTECYQELLGRCCIRCLFGLVAMKYGRSCTAWGNLATNQFGKCFVLVSRVFQCQAAGPQSCGWDESARTMPRFGVWYPRKASLGPNQRLVHDDMSCSSRAHARRLAECHESPFKACKVGSRMTYGHGGSLERGVRIGTNTRTGYVKAPQVLGPIEELRACHCGRLQWESEARRKVHNSPVPLEFR